MIKQQTNYICPKCGQKLYTDNLVYTSNPPMYRYWCESCYYDQYLYSEEAGKLNIDKPNPPKAGTTPSPKQCNCKQRTVLSVKDFVILYNMVNNEIAEMESQAQDIYYYMFDKNMSDVEANIQMEKNMELLRQDPYYQDLLRIRDKLGELNIEIEAPSVEVE